VTVAELNNLLNRFGQMQQMMKKMGKFQRMMGKMGGAGMNLSWGVSTVSRPALTSTTRRSGGK
jgi:signal recognition particle GTPase